MRRLLATSRSLLIRRIPGIILVTIALLTTGPGMAHGQNAAVSDPDKDQIEFYRDYAVIHTQCLDWPEAYVLRDQLTDAGCTISVLVTPRYFLGWVPDNLKDAVAALPKLSSLLTAPHMRKSLEEGPDAVLVERAFEHCRRARAGLLTTEQPTSEIEGPMDSPIDNAGLEELQEFLHRYERINDSVAVLKGQSTETWRKEALDTSSWPRSLLGIPYGDMHGVINVDIFMLESTGDSSVYDWTQQDYNTTVDNWNRSFDFWARSARQYGKAVTFRASVFSYRKKAMHVSSEPIQVLQGNDWQLMKEALLNLGFREPYGSVSGAWIGMMLSLGACGPCALAIAFDHMNDNRMKEFIRAMKWNDKRAKELGVRQSFVALTNLRPAGSGEYKRAYCRVISTGLMGGSVTLDVLGTITSNICIGVWTSCMSDHIAAVLAHETGHAFGAPDEYKENHGDADCLQPNFWFRGAGNPNCEATNKNSVTAMMRDNTAKNYNYEQISSATPIHVGWIKGLPRTIKFLTRPTGIQMKLPIRITRGDTFTTAKDLYLGLGYRIPKASVPHSASLAGTTYDFEGWYEDGVRVNDGPTRDITINSSVSEYEARFEKTTTGIDTPNRSLEARLGLGKARSPSAKQWDPGIVLIWRSTLADQQAGYHVQIERQSTWKDLTSIHTDIQRAPLYCYANVPDIDGWSFIPKETYRFRVVPYNQHGIRGTPSNVAIITLRDVAPAAETYGYDADEPNNTVSKAVVRIIAPGTTDSIPAAITYTQPHGGLFVFDEDYYVFQADSMSAIEELEITVTTRTGSLFKPFVLWRNLASSSWIEVKPNSFGKYVFAVNSSGSYLVKVTSVLASKHLIGAETSWGHWGEYAIVARRQTATRLYVPGLCPGCTRVQRIASGGVIYPLTIEPALSRVFTSSGLLLPGTLPVLIEAVPDPGWTFEGWDADLQGEANPGVFTLEPGKNAPGESMLMARFNTLPEGTYELVYNVPSAYASVLGESKRVRGSFGDVVDISLPEGALNGFDFLGWQGPFGDDDVAEPHAWEFSPRLRIRLTRNMWIRPFLRPRPCTGVGLEPFVFGLSIQNAQDEYRTLIFGMEPNASDSLESGQSELPPPPVTDIMDARLMGIPGAPQGSETDIRGMKPSFTYTGRIQPGKNGDPVVFRWEEISPSMPGTFLFTVGSEVVDMRRVNELHVPIGAVGTVTISVSEDTCRQLPQDAIDVEVTDVNADGFPYIQGRLCVTDTQGNPLLNVRPHDVLLYDRGSTAEDDSRRAHLLSLRPEDGCYRFEGLLLDDKPRDVAHKDRGLVAVVTSGSPLGEAEVEYGFTIATTPTVSDTSNGNGKPNPAFYWYHPDGWQLVSLPIMVSDPAVFSIYGPDLADGRVYAFDPDAGYEAVGNMSFGRGYWAHFSTDNVRNLNGIERTIFEYNDLPGMGQSMANGWNLIGGITYEVQRTSIEESPPGAIVSLFEFDQGYKSATSLRPGMGYWIKLKSNATLKAVRSLPGSPDTLGLTAGASLYDRLLLSLPRTRSWSVTDAEGANAILFATDADLRDIPYEDIAELPPLPPAGGFDARLAGNRVFTLDDSEMLMNIQGKFPITVKTDADATSQVQYRVERRDRSLQGLIDGRTGGSVVIYGPDEGTKHACLVIRKITSDARTSPTASTLGTIYPNPLRLDAHRGNATISFAIDEPGLVELSVYDVLGRRVASITRGEYVTGVHAVSWNCRNASGAVLPAGCYFIEFRTAGIRQVKNIVLAK